MTHLQLTMEAITIKLQSVSDIITNSSSEIFQIKAEMPEHTFYGIWTRLLNKYEKGWNHSGIKDTYLGYFEVENEYIILRFPSMCNIGYDMREALEELFGKGNVQYLSY